MKTAKRTSTFADQERLVPKILAFFPKPPNDVCIDEEDFLKLRSTIDYAVHFYCFLTEKIGRKIDPTDDVVEMLDQDIAVYMESFWATHENLSVLLHSRRLQFKWKAYSTPAQLKRDYLRSYNLLTAETTALADRYYHLIALTKLQIIFFGTTFI